MFELSFQVDYVDTDAMGIVHHGRYCRYLERARVRWLEDQGLSYKEMEEQGFALPLRKLSLEYFKPLRFDDKARIRLKVGSVSRSRILLAYEIFDHQGEALLSRAETEHVLIRNQKLVSIPLEWRKLWLPQKEQK